MKQDRAQLGFDGLLAAAAEDNRKREIEPRRVCRRLRTLRGRSHDEEDIDEILT